MDTRSTVAENLEYPPCPLCGTDAILAKRYDLNPFVAVQCANCRLWYLKPRLKEEHMLKLYADGSYFMSDDERGYSSYGAQQQSLKFTFRRFLRQLNKNGYTGGRLLEVGCGYGYLLKEAQPYFSYRAGTDYSEEAVKNASQVCDRAILGGIDDIPPGETFDTIVTVGVIEHIYSPLEFNAKLSARLVNGGKLIHATPHMGSFWRHIMGTRWASFKIPEHVTYYDQNSLTKLFDKGGFRNLRRFSFPHAFPLSLVAEKLGMRVAGKLGALNLWLPATTLAIAGQK